MEQDRRPGRLVPGSKKAKGDQTGRAERNLCSVPKPTPLLSRSTSLCCYYYYYEMTVISLITTALPTSQRNETKY